ncbi:transcriptional activator RfaH [Labrys okinawensis]|uniref:Transcriptional activator RfaH n=1 Tax=Labrys okinawensis TaxID=346911 RepID=A0A2S9QIQ6_9HYPH|nr:transcriptional activator RfaH [Labrys okinawensis]PRH89251.1 transcriptional activator RfaH [Labrys okinawensis]
MVRRSQSCLRRVNANGQRWYVVQTRARSEETARFNLEAQGFEVFLPRTLRTVLHARRRRTAMNALFPGYLFVRLDLERERWRSINGTIGVVQVVMGSSLPLPVPDGVVESILTYVDAEGIARLDRDLAQGQTVRVTLGPFTESIGPLMRLDPNERARVLLEIMGRAVEITLPRRALEAV